MVRIRNDAVTIVFVEVASLLRWIVIVCSSFRGSLFVHFTYEVFKRPKQAPGDDIERSSTACGSLSLS